MTLTEALQQDNLNAFALHRGHSLADIRTNIRGIADGELTTTYGDIVARNIVGEVDGHSEMTRIVDEHAVEPNKVAHEMRQENRAVFTVVIGIEDALLAKEVTVVTPYRFIVGIEETSLIRVLAINVGLTLYPPIQLLSK